MELRRNFSVKSLDCLKDFQFISPTLLETFINVIRYCQGHGLPLVITRIIDKKIPGVSKTNTHAEGRAIDISVRDWGEEDIKNIVDYFNTKYYHSGAFSLSDGNPRYMVDHAGTARHIHIQIRSDI